MADISLPVFGARSGLGALYDRICAWLERPAPDHIAQEEERRFLREMLERNPDAFQSETDLQLWMSCRPGDF